jgi:hypothetical protein
LKYKCKFCGCIFELNYYQEARIRRKTYITYSPIVINQHLIFKKAENGGVMALCPNQFNGGEK